MSRQSNLPLSISDFLRREFPRIERAIREASEIADEYPTACCTRARSALELIASECYRANYGALPTRDHSLLSLLQDDSFATRAKDIYELCFELKRLGDPAAHRREMSRTEAARAVEILAHISEWFCHDISPSTFHSPIVVPKRSPQSGRAGSKDVVEVERMLANSGLQPGTIGYRLLKLRLESDGSDLEAESRPQEPVDYAAQADRAWSSLAVGQHLRAQVVDRVQFGLVLDVGVRAFLPVEEFADYRIKNIEQFVGQYLKVYVVELDKLNKKIVLALDGSPFSNDA